MIVLSNKEVNQSNVDKLKKVAVNQLIDLKMIKIELTKYNLEIDGDNVNSYLNKISSGNIQEFKNKFKVNNLDYKIYLILFYGFIWFFSLYKIFYFSKIGLKLYVLLVTFGFVLNMLSDYKVYGSLYYFMTLFEHLIIGAIISLSFFSKIKTKFT